LIFWLGNEGDETADERTSDVILKKEIPLHSDADEMTANWLDVATMLPATTKGVLELRVNGVGATAVSRLLLTNMSLVAKKTTPYRASVFSDRGVYRPGDNAHVVAIVRDGKDRAPDQALPVEVKLVDPRARVAKKVTLKTNGAGVLAFDYDLPAFADTGHWRV